MRVGQTSWDVTVPSTRKWEKHCFIDVQKVVSQRVYLDRKVYTVLNLAVCGKVVDSFDKSGKWKF